MVPPLGVYQQRQRKYPPLPSLRFHLFFFFFLFFLFFIYRSGSFCGFLSYMHMQWWTALHYTSTLTFTSISLVLTCGPLSMHLWLSLQSLFLDISCTFPYFSLTCFSSVFHIFLSRVYRFPYFSLTCFRFPYFFLISVFVFIFLSHMFLAPSPNFSTYSDEHLINLTSITCLYFYPFFKFLSNLTQFFSQLFMSLLCSTNSKLIKLLFLWLIKS